MRVVLTRVANGCVKVALWCQWRVVPFLHRYESGGAIRREASSGWAAYLLAMVDESADPAQPFAERGASGLEGSITDMLRDSRWSKLRWHAFRRGGCAASYHRGPHLRFLLWWGRWRRLQTALEYATRYTDPEVVGPLLLHVADAGDYIGSVVEVPLGNLSPEAMYAKETVAIKNLAKGLGTLPAADARAPKQAADGEDGESSGSDSSASSSESSGSSLESAGSGTTTAKRDVGKYTVGTTSGKRAVGTFVVGVKSATGHQPRGGGSKRKRGPAGAPAPKSAGGATSGRPTLRRWRLPVVGGVVRVHGPVPGGPKVVLGGGSVRSRPAARGRLRRRGADGRASPAGRSQKVPRRGEGSESSRPVRELAGGGAAAGGVAWKFKPRGEDRRNPITL